MHQTQSLSRSELLSCKGVIVFSHGLRFELGMCLAIVIVLLVSARRYLLCGSVTSRWKGVRGCREVDALCVCVRACVCACITYIHRIACSYYCSSLIFSVDTDQLSSSVFVTDLNCY